MVNDRLRQENRKCLTDTCAEVAEAFFKKTRKLISGRSRAKSLESNPRQRLAVS